MKKLILLLFPFVIASCSKVNEDRLEGTWKVKEVKEIPVDIFDLWKTWLDTTEVKVVFFKNGDVKTFYLKSNGEEVHGFSSGTYVLFEEDEKLQINDTSIVFNPHNTPLDVTSLRRNHMTLEGRFYLDAIAPSVPADSFRVLEWTLVK